MWYPQKPTDLSLPRSLLNTLLTRVQTALRTDRANETLVTQLVRRCTLRIFLSSQFPCPILSCLFLSHTHTLSSLRLHPQPQLCYLLCTARAFALSAPSLNSLTLPKPSSDSSSILSLLSANPSINLQFDAISHRLRLQFLRKPAPAALRGDSRLRRGCLEAELSKSSISSSSESSRQPTPLDSTPAMIHEESLDVTIKKSAHPSHTALKLRQLLEDVANSSEKRPTKPQTQRTFNFSQPDKSVLAATAALLPPPPSARISTLPAALMPPAEPLDARLPHEPARTTDFKEPLTTRRAKNTPSAALGVDLWQLPDLLALSAPGSSNYHVFRSDSNMPLWVLDYMQPGVNVLECQ